MTRVFLLEPTHSPAWLPFADSRPVAELRAGAWLIRERWEAIASAETEAIFGPIHLHAFREAGVPPVRAQAAVGGPAFIGRSDFAPAGVPPEFDPATSTRFTHDTATVGWWVAEGDRWEGPSDAGDAVELDGIALRGAFDLITALEHLLAADCADFLTEGGASVPDGVQVIGDADELVILDALVEPGCTFDVRGGAVILEQGAYITSGTRLQGPCYVGPGTIILGGSVANSAIGPQCRVRGEVSSSVFLGYANKAHDGFVGHSVVGHWANLGAGTITSNLKNTYGNVRLSVGETRIETERQYLGSLIGDHVKTAIGTMLGTGTVLGAGANVFGDRRPPQHVPAFAWGLDGARQQLDGFLTVVERVMPRRKVEVDDAIRSMLTAIYRHAVGG
jgi:UDP-N-acetylglucosamine diphosphorylase/glucosamine-1-phosphate N-acetyltransferase